MSGIYLKNQITNMKLPHDALMHLSKRNTPCYTNSLFTPLVLYIPYHLTTMEYVYPRKSTH